MEAVAVALIGFAGVVLAAWLPLRKLRKENTQQHAASYGLIQSIDKRTERIESKFDGHIGWHKGRGDDI